ncbi:asparagine synthase (glutamine-hydrolyzing) [Flavobacterium sp. PL11]|uniref:asparagine synthase C-terminal domain-containing protein n=1 Tax=Flavobacterium sp. PL11 TaxID=3071717 RepID=UPI002E062CE8|nr:asparagine synthase (glutamine-hydrolyzing) [Flavobacterium sp. PL11]
MNELNLNLLSFKSIKIDEKTEIYYRGIPFYDGQVIDFISKNSQFFLRDLCILTHESVLEFSEKIKGSFTFLIVKESSIIALSDIIRTFPLFYKINGSAIEISDSITNFKGCLIDENKLSAFITSGYSFGSSTIYKDVFGIQAAEIVFISKIDLVIKSSRYFKFIPEKNTKAVDKEVFVASFNAQMEKVIEAMIISTPQVNNWIVPLSGGHDSRQIVNFLYKKGIKNVICFSYGKPGNTQAKLSKQIAEALNYEWHFIEYSEQKWNKLHKNGVIDHYIDFAFQGVSTPHLQDFLAIYELKQLTIITKNDVIIPGHTLDMLSGGHFSTLDQNCANKVDSILRTAKRHSKLYENSLILKSHLYESLNEIYDEILLEPSQFQEYINWQERQAKFIVNSCRVYEFFDFEFRLPFWDIDLVKFFMKLNAEQRKERLFFKISEREGILIPELAAIPFEDEIIVKQTKQSFKNKIASRIPNYIKARMAKWLGKQYEAESLNQIYALKADTVEGLIGSINQFPKQTHPFLITVLPRPTHRADYHLLSGLYAVSRILNKTK